MVFSERGLDELYIYITFRKDEYYVTVQPTLIKTSADDGFLPKTEYSRM